MPRKRREAMTWVRAILEEVLNLSEIDIATISRMEAQKLWNRIMKHAHTGWLMAFPRLAVLSRAEGDRVADLDTLKRETSALVTSLKTGEPYDIPTFSVEGVLEAQKVHRWAKFSGDIPTLALQVIYACVAALEQEPNLRFIRCGVCNRWIASAKKNRKYCSIQCARKQAENTYAKTDKRRQSTANYKHRKRIEAFAKARGVPIEWVRSSYEKGNKRGKWKLWIERPKGC